MKNFTRYLSLVYKVCKFCNVCNPNRRIVKLVYSTLPKVLIPNTQYPILSIYLRIDNTFSAVEIDPLFFNNLLPIASGLSIPKIPDKPLATPAIELAV